MVALIACIIFVVGWYSDKNEDNCSQSSELYTKPSTGISYHVVNKKDK